MRKTIFVFIALVAAGVCIGLVRSCGSDETVRERFARQLTYAQMFEHQDQDFGYTLRYPSFFTAQPDSLQEEAGRARFVFNDEGVTVVVEGHVVRNNGLSLQEGMDSLAKVLHATDRKLDKDGFTLSGPQYEEGSRISDYSYYSRFVANRKLWFVYTMVYPNDYKDVLGRMFKEIDEWQVWERPKLQFKQATSQAPRSISE